MRVYLDALYRWVLHWAGHRHAPWVLFWVAFAESSFFPIPPDVLLMPMILANLQRAWLYALICTVGSVLGGVAGYAMGYYGFAFFGQPLIDFYHAQEKFILLQHWYTEWDVLIVFAAGFSPIPYKIFTVLSGFMQANLLMFILASLLSRGARFFLVAGILYWGGERLRGWIERNLPPLSLLAIVLLVLLVVLFKL